MAIGHGSRHGMTIDTGGRFEYSLSLGSSATLDCRLALPLNPAIEVSTWLNVDAQQHLGVLRPAILSALAQINSRLLGIDPHAVRMIRNQIGLAGKARDPEAVVCISGE